MIAPLESVLGVELARPWALVLVLLIVPALRSRLRRGRSALWFAPFPLLVRRLDRGGERVKSPASWRVRARSLPLVLDVGALILIAFALARPVVRERVATEVEGIDVVLVLDVSSSMAARDLDGERTRLEVAREAAIGFVRARAQDRIALISFARYADLLCPFTLDHEALAEILGELEPVAAEGAEDLTGIGAAAARAADLLEATRGRSKVVVLLSDGEETAADGKAAARIAPEQAALLASAFGVRVHVIAVAPTEVRDDGPQRDLEPVRALAIDTGGTFSSATDAATLGRIYARIDRLEREKIATPRFELRERFPPVLAAALALLLLASLLRGGPMERLP